jgi:exosortase/archaeosortase family protein
VPSDTVRSRNPAASFALKAVAWSLGLFGVLRLNWVETHGLLPLTQLQGRLGVLICGTSALPINATLACSGADVLALCLGAILAYPASWRMRLWGAGGGLALILGLNTLRIGTLGRVVASPAWFETLHLYVWPAALTLAVAGYVFGWMRVADGRASVDSPFRESVTRAATPATAMSPARLSPRFIVLAAAFLLVFTAASPFYLESAGVLTVAAFITRATAAALHLFGVEARAAANVLWTPRGAFAVTQECISTPLIPLYLAAVVAYAGTWRQRALGLIAAAPLFVGLGIARLLVVALPAAFVASPLYLVHAFYQLLLGAVVVSAAAFWRHGATSTAWRRALTGIALGVAVALLLGAGYARVLTRATEMIGGVLSGFVAGTPLDDPQGAIALLPAFQVGLYMALWVAAFVAFGWRRFVTGLVLLELVQLATLLALHILASHSGFTPHVRDVRAWAVIGPLLVIAAVVNVGRLHRRPTSVAGPVGDGACG